MHTTAGDERHTWIGDLRGLRSLTARNAAGRLRLQHFRGFLFTGFGRRGPDEFGQRLAFDQQLHLNAVEAFAFQQRLRNTTQDLPIGVQNVLGALIAGGHKLLYFLVNLDGRIFAEVALRGQVAAQEISCWFLPKASGPRSDMPNSHTMRRAMPVACSMSLPAPW